MIFLEMILMYLASYFWIEPAELTPDPLLLFLHFFIRKWKESGINVDKLMFEIVTTQSTKFQKIHFKKQDYITLTCAV